MELQLGESAALKDVDVTGRILTVTLDVRRSALNKVLFWLSLICELPFAPCMPLIFCLWPFAPPLLTFFC